MEVYDGRGGVWAEWRLVRGVEGCERDGGVWEGRSVVGGVCCVVGGPDRLSRAEREGGGGGVLIKDDKHKPSSSSSSSQTVVLLSSTALELPLPMLLAMSHVIH